MGTEQQFCLRWNNHQSTLVAVFDTLLESGTLVDCTLAAEGQYLKAHKVVLSACSPYFELLLSQHYEKHPIVILKDVKFQELKAMMDYMYRGEVNISQDQLGALLKAAESLQIKGLSDSGGGGTERESSDKRHERRKEAPPPPPPPPRTPPILPHSSGLTIEHRRPAPPPPAPPQIVELPEDSPPLPTLPKVSGSREGSVSPVPRKRKKHRRRSNGGEDSASILPIVESHETSSSCELPSQPQMTAAVNIPATITPVVPSPVVVKSAPEPALSLGPEEQTDTDMLSRSLPSTHSNVASPQSMPHEPEPVQKVEPPSELLLEPKAEYLDEDMNEDSVEDLTLDDDMDEMDHARPGPSHGGEGSSSQGAGFAPWHVAADRSTDEVFMAAQEAVGAHRDSQGGLGQEMILLNNSEPGSFVNNVVKPMTEVFIVDMQPSDPEEEQKCKIIIDEEEEPESKLDVTTELVSECIAPSPEERPTETEQQLRGTVDTQMKVESIAEDVQEAITQSPLVERHETITQLPLVELQEVVTQSPLVKLQEAITQSPVVKLKETITQSPLVELQEAVTQSPLGKLQETITQLPLAKLQETITQSPLAKQDHIKDGLRMSNSVDPLGVKHTNQGQANPTSSSILETVRFPVVRLKRLNLDIVNDASKSYTRSSPRIRKKWRKELKKSKTCSKLIRSLLPRKKPSSASKKSKNKDIQTSVSMIGTPSIPKEAHYNKLSKLLTKKINALVFKENLLHSEETGSTSVKNISCGFEGSRSSPSSKFTTPVIPKDKLVFHKEVSTFTPNTDRTNSGKEGVGQQSDSSHTYMHSNIIHKGEDGSLTQKEMMTCIASDYAASSPMLKTVGVFSEKGNGDGNRKVSMTPGLISQVQCINCLHLFENNRLLFNHFMSCINRPKMSMLNQASNIITLD